MSSELWEQPTNLYVSTVISLEAARASRVKFPDQVEVSTHSGEAVLVMNDVQEIDDAPSTLNPYQRYRATMTVPGVLTRKIAVEIDVLPWSATSSELAVVPRRGTWLGARAANRYFEATLALLDSLGESLVNDSTTEIHRAA